MSTIFAIHKHGKIIPIVDDCSFILDEEFENMVDVAFRGNFGGMRFTNEIAHLLPKSTPVYGMDNSQQGIFTIGDIINEIIEKK